MKFDDGLLVTEGKMLLFLKQEVLLKGKHSKLDDKGNPVPLSKSALEGYVKAVSDLYNQQTALKINTHPHPRAHVYRSFMSTYAHQTFKRRIETYEERGKHTLSDGYTLKELVLVGR